MLKERANDIKADLLMARDRLITLINTTPDDKLKWSPSPTARTPIQLVGHSGGALFAFSEMAQHGFTRDGVDTASFDADLREKEASFKSRDEVIGLLNQGCDAYCAYVDSLDEQALAEKVPFIYGPTARVKVLEMGPAHTSVHGGQLAYLQTIWGDRDWHLG